jgi:3-oxo-5-alpha-steroid 4-dehydrogenase 1
LCGYYFHFCYFCALQKNFNMNLAAFNLFLGVMSLIALIVFVALYFVKAGYGIFRTSSWGAAISNKLAWILMEAPVFLVMCVMWMYSERRFEPVILTFFLFFQLHYFQRAFIFPLLLKGKSKMPLAIMSMGILFNLLNGYARRMDFLPCPRNDVPVRLVYLPVLYNRYFAVFYGYAGELVVRLYHPPFA